jgi:micrococcal nuclease
MWTVVVRVLAGAACVAVVAGCGSAAFYPGRPRSAPPWARAGPACRGPCAAVTVVRVVDGDTLILRGLGRVRLIGLDAPETWLRHDCQGEEATRALRRLTPPGSPVHTAGDAERRDRYGRRLLYVWTPAGEFVNAALVRKGLARAMPIPPDTTFAPLIRRAEDTARHSRAGIWRTNPAACAVAHRRPVRRSETGVSPARSQDPQ